MTNPFEEITEHSLRIEILLINFRIQEIVNHTEELLTTSQTAELLSLTPTTLYELVYKNAIPYSKKSKRLYFSTTELLDWIRSCRNKSINSKQSNHGITKQTN